MLYKILLIFIILSTANCTQNLISLVKTPYELKNISVEEMFVRAGIIDPLESSAPQSTHQQHYPQGTLQPPNQELKQEFHTIVVPQNSYFTINVDTKNYLIASPYYSSSGFIYEADRSLPKQGKFEFSSGSIPGLIRIRIYDTEGILQSESIWYIEIQ